MLPYQKVRRASRLGPYARIQLQVVVQHRRPALPTMASYARLLQA